jgi:hypothetical protein
MSAKSREKQKHPGGQAACCRKCGLASPSHRAGEDVEGLCASCYQEDFADVVIPRLTILDVRPSWPGGRMSYASAEPSPSPLGNACFAPAPGGAPAPMPIAANYTAPRVNLAPLDMERAPLFLAAMRNLARKK